MALSSRPAAVHYALSVAVVAGIILSAGWREARREVRDRADRERALAAELTAVKESLAASRQELDGNREATEKVLEDLEQRIASLTDARDSLNAKLDDKTYGPYVVPDGDGREDRDLLRTIVETAGGRFDNEVDETGILLVNGNPPADGQPQVTDRTRFIVIGAIPEIKDGDDPKTVDRIQRIVDLRRELETAARARGIRVISLQDFLTFIRYKPQRRLFVPGRDVPYRPKPKSARASAFGGR